MYIAVETGGFIYVHVILQIKIVYLVKSPFNLENSLCCLSTNATVTIPDKTPISPET